MVVTGRSPERADIILEQLSEQRIGSIIFSVPGEPTTDIALVGAQKAREAACDWVRNICSRLKLPLLSEYKITEADFPLLVEKAQVASSMNGNPVLLIEKELVKILQQAL